MLSEIFSQIVMEKQKTGIRQAVTINYLKEYLQYLVLNMLYNHKDYKTLVFKGGSCLRICYGLPRLSEDLDFDYDGKNTGEILLADLEIYLKQEIEQKYFSEIQTKIQGKGRIYLKFPILKELGLAGKNDSDLLFVKIETESNLLPKAKYVLTPISNFGYNFLARNYDLPTLMSGKINAILERMWFKGEKNEIDIKGRDFYDLYWFLQKGIKPNMEVLRKTTGIKTIKKLRKVLEKKIMAVVTPQKLSYDLVNFLPESEFVRDFSKNYLIIIINLFNKELR